jgi:ribonuclease D
MKYLTETTEIEALFFELTNAKILWLDTEVADYMTKNPRLSLIQILPDYQQIIPENTYILDVLDKPELVDKFISLIMVNKEIEKVFHNAKYDLRFLGKTKAKNVTCTLEIAQNLPYYLLPLSNLKLKTLAEQIGGFYLVDKLEQTSDWGKRPLTKEQLEYAKMDSVYLAKVHQKLLELIPENEPNPHTDNLDKIAVRYRQIELQWKLLNSEIDHLKERAKKAMEAQNIKENSTFKLSSYERTTVKANLIELSQMIVNLELEEKIEITLTKEVQKQLSQVLLNVKIAEEKNKIVTLKIKENEQQPDFNF